MKLSYVIVTHNRREALLSTLRTLHDNTPLPRSAWEAWVVDNASTDGSADAVRRNYPGVHLLPRPRNEGVWARSLAFDKAAGKYLVLLDDDSYPIEDAVSRSIAYLESTPSTAAVVGRVVLPDGSCEACAMPAVMLSGAVCIRRSVLMQVGGFRREFFRKAGEYDLSFRILQAGHRIERFEDIVYRHDKVMAGRSRGFAHRMDLRNNLILTQRYLPEGLREEYWSDWSQRYSAVARHAGCGLSARLAMLEARWWAIKERLNGRQVLSDGTIETLFELKRQQDLIGDWSLRNRVGRVVVSSFSKNLFATYRGCIKSALQIVAIADDNPAFAGTSYRGIPILPHQEAFARRVDGAVLSNVNPAQVDRGMAAIARAFAGPALRLWEPAYLPAAAVAA